MIQIIKSEIKIAGINFLLILSALAAALIVFSAAAGELIDFYPVSFEVIFPFFAAVAAGEWGKTGADRNCDLIVSQGRSLFRWAAVRYMVVFGISGVFALACMAASWAIRGGTVLWRPPVLYFPVAFFLSSLCMLVGLKCTQEHIAALTGGLIWLAALLMRGLLRIPGVEYVYPFICFAGDQNQIWLWNKCIFMGMGVLIWGVIRRVCSGRNSLLFR